MPLPPKPTILRKVYLDHAATTSVDPQVLEAMLPFFTEIFYNPSTLYAGGLEAQTAISNARKTCATLLHTQPDTIVFTSGGTESCNLAIFGTADAYERETGKKGHIITTNIEHHAVEHACHQLEKRGWSVTYLPVNAQGCIRVKQIQEAMTDDTVLISIIYANNEIGTIQHIADIGRAILTRRKETGSAYPYFHSDACQAGGALELDIEKLHLDLMSLNGSKIYGPKGSGMLYKRRGAQMNPCTVGGIQEFGYRAGTEAVHAIVGFAKAFQLAQEHRGEEQKYIAELRGMLWQGIQKQIPNVMLNGTPLGEERLANNLHVHFEGVEQEAMLLYLDEYGIQVGIGSACTSRGIADSHVMKAIGQKTDGNIRFTLGKSTTKEDIEYVLEYLPAIVETVRGLKK